MLTVLLPQHEKSQRHVLCASRSRPAPRIGRHAACVSCKVKKLRCSGENPACERCLSKGRECTYTEKRKRTSKKEQKSPRKIKCSQAGWPSGEEWKPMTPDDKADLVQEKPVNKMSSENPQDCSPHGGSARLAKEEQRGFSVFMLTEYGTGLAAADGRRGDLEAPSAGYGNGVKGDFGARPHADDSLLSPATQRQPSNTFTVAAADDFSLETCSFFASTSETGTAFPVDTEAMSVNSADGQSNNEISTPSCECVKQAILDLEESVAWAEIISPLTAEATLAANKRTMADCEALLSCDRCRSSVATLLTLLVADKAIGILQRLHATYTSWTKRAVQQQVDGPLRDELSEQPIFVGDYHANTPKERARIMDALLSLQLTRLQEMLAQGRSHIDESHDQLQAQMFEMLQGRLRDVISHFEEVSQISIG